MNTPAVPGNQSSNFESTAAWHVLTPDETRNKLNASIESGLSSTEACRRQDQRGSNELVERGLSVIDLGISLLVSTAAFWGIDVKKMIVRRRQ